jgi:transcription elongation factor GreA
MNAKDDSVFLTEEGLRELEKELVFLKNTRRREVAIRLKEAIAYGDLSENSEYQEAKEEQAFIEGRIAELEQKVKHVEIISDKTKKKGEKIRLGSTVQIKEKGQKNILEYTIVGSMEADPLSGRISNESPLGVALLGQKKGDIVSVQAPGGIFEYEVVHVD